MGWSEGQSLGKERDGPTEPVSLLPYKFCIYSSMWFFYYDILYSINVSIFYMIILIFINI